MRLSNQKLLSGNKKTLNQCLYDAAKYVLVVVHIVCLIG